MQWILLKQNQVLLKDILVALDRFSQVKSRYNYIIFYISYTGVVYFYFNTAATMWLLNRRIRISNCKWVVLIRKKCFHDKLPPAA